MCTYLKNMDGWKPRALKNKSFAEIKELFDKAMTRINNFVDFRTELVEEGSKKAEESSSTKKQKVDDDQEAAELKRCLEIVPDDEDDVTIDATSFSSKSPTIIDYKIHKEGSKSYFQIIRADGSSQMYYTFSKMLKNFNREYLEVLWSIVNARFEKVQPVDDMDCYLLHTLKTMFEYHVKDSVWKNQWTTMAWRYAWDAVSISYEITDLDQILEEVLLTANGDGVAGITPRHRDPSSDDVRDLATASGHGRLNEDLESSTVEVSEEHAIRLYLEGLPTKLEMSVKMFRLKTLSDAYCLTTLQEATLESIKKKSKPFVNQTNERFEEEEEEYLDADETLVDIVNEEVQAHISLNALSGVNSFQTIRVIGLVVKQHELHNLIDSGSTHNFLDVNMAKRIG
nr:retrotransposable element Tf2 [Tanacetum cinerariifolium]